MEHRQPRWTREDTIAISAITLVALALRLVFVAFIHPAPHSDDSWYYARALDIAEGRGFSVNGLPTSFWPPGWPYVLGWYMMLFGHSVLGGAILQAVLNALTVPPIYVMGRCIAGRTCAIAGSAAYAALPSAIEWSSFLNSEELYTVLLTWATFVWIAKPTRSLGWYAFSGALTGASALARPSSLIAWLVLLAYLLTIGEERRHPRRTALAVGITALCTLLFVTPWIVRDYRDFHTFVLISNNGGVSLYQGNNDRATGGYSNYIDPKIEKMIDDPRTEVQGDRLSERLGVEYIKAHPGRTLVTWARNLKALYISDYRVANFAFSDGLRPQGPPPGNRVFETVSFLNTALYFVLMALSAIGFIACFWGRTASEWNPGWRLLAGMIAYNTLIIVPIAGLDRYRFPVMPDFAVFAGLGAVALAEYARRSVISTRTAADAAAIREH